MSSFRPLLLTLVSAVALVACAEPPDNLLSQNERRERIEELYREYRQDFPEAPEVDVEELVRMRRDKDQDVIVVDAREPEERAVSIIPGAISKDQFQEAEDEYKDKTIVAYCTIGYRSGQLVEELRAKNLDAYNLKGSILAWTHAGQPVVDPEGSETKRVHTYGRRWALLPDGYEAVY